MQFVAHIETTRYKKVLINLVYKPKEDSPLSQPPRVWYWEVEGKMGFDKCREVAIASAKKHINDVKKKVLV